MNLSKTTLAKSLALSTAIFWITCSVFVALFPEFSLTITKWWMHGMSFPKGWNLSFANFLWGGITMSISAWLFGYVIGWSLEYFSKK